MSEQEESEADRRARLRSAAALRKKLDAVFGSDSAAGRDESGRAWGERGDARHRDDDLRRDVPPHHGGH